MNRPKLLLLTLSAFTLASTSGCTQSADSNQINTESSAPFIRVIDSANRTIEIKSKPKRILSLVPVASEFIAHLGAFDLLVGRTDHCNHPKALTGIVSVGSLFPPNYEKIHAVKPDLILIASGQLDVRKRLEELGHVVFVVQPDSIDAVQQMLLKLGKIIGSEEIANEKSRAFSKRLETIVGKVSKRKPRVFWEIWDSPLQTVGTNGFMGDLLLRAGGRNVVKDSKNPWPKVSPESIVSTNPELIIVSSEAARQSLLTKQRPGWDQTDAVKNGHIYRPPDPDVISRPGPRILDAFEWLVDTINGHSVDGTP